MKKITKDQFWLLVKQFVLALFIVLVLRGFLLIPLQVRGNSMKETLHQNDTLVMEKISRIKRFNIVVFTQADGSSLIKRVIGLPGEKIAVKNDRLYINDRYVHESFLKEDKKEDTSDIPFTSDFSLKELTGQVRLKKDEYFVMGDNRRLSKDSRTFGPIQAQEIIGKARFVFYPLKCIQWLR